jgi:hypothetical protein
VYGRGAAQGLVVLGDSSVRSLKLAKEMERQLERPLTSDERRWLALCAAATPAEEQVEPGDTPERRLRRQGAAVIASRQKRQARDLP